MDTMEKTLLAVGTITSILVYGVYNMIGMVL